MLEGELIGFGRVVVDLGELDAARLDLLLDIGNGLLEFGDACLGAFVEPDGGFQRAFVDRLARQRRQPGDLLVGARDDGPVLHHLLELDGLVAQQLLELVRILRHVVAEHLQHAVERVHRHAAIMGDGLDLPALDVRQVGNGEKKLAAFLKDFALYALTHRRGDAEIEQPAQALVDPWTLAAGGLEIDLLGDHAHDDAELLAAHRFQMAQQGSSVGAVAVRIAVERGAPRLGGKADNRAKMLALVLRRRRQLRRAAQLAQSAVAHRDRRLVRLDADHRIVGERIVAAGVEHDDGDRNRVLETVENIGERNELLAGPVERRQIGIDRDKEVLAARLDSMAGIIEDRDVRLGSVLDEIFKVARKAPGLAVRRHFGLEAELVEQFLDRARIILRVGERRQMFVGGISDDERDALQRLVVLRLGARRRGDNQQHHEDGSRKCRPDALIQAN